MLTVVATPIGNPKDISLRALEVLQEADLIIGEERREASTLLKKLSIPVKELYLLNEHSTEKDILELGELCRTRKVALISDCGTPSFYDPGYQLIKFCRSHNIPFTSVPGASSLMTLLSLVSEKVTSFYFAGFLPADTELRQLRLKELMSSSEAIVLMDTPYRLLKLMSELELNSPTRKILLGLNLTQDNELCLEGTAKEILLILKSKTLEKAEFILCLYAFNEGKINLKPIKRNPSLSSTKEKQSRSSSHKKWYR